MQDANNIACDYTNWYPRGIFTSFHGNTKEVAEVDQLPTAGETIIWSCQKGRHCHQHFEVIWVKKGKMAMRNGWVNECA